ncbi:CAP domain-containing protein [Thalassorhabdus alkalitolerans]|uniref:CAP domain-containing protein n=1 Tax=Thalassorhabdus alkalitolerans TaxID=2282697 RepID=A0ABW0YTA6_9BACI
MVKVFWMIALFLLIPTTALGQEENTYTVEPGDTMWSISQQHDVTVDELLQANPDILDVNTIYANQVIQLPQQGDGQSTPSQAEQSEEGLVQEVIRLTNEERAQHGLDPLEPYGDLANVAEMKSVDMRDQDYFSHYSPTYGDPFEMMTSQGIDFQGAGENLAAGQTSPEQVVREWMESPSHRDNILRPDYTHIGVGHVEGGSFGTYWTQMFVVK